MTDDDKEHEHARLAEHHRDRAEQEQRALAGEEPREPRCCLCGGYAFKCGDGPTACRFDDQARAFLSAVVHSGDLREFPGEPVVLALGHAFMVAEERAVIRLSEARTKRLEALEDVRVAASALNYIPTPVDNSPDYEWSFFQARKDALRAALAKVPT